MHGRLPRRAAWWGICGAVLLAHLVLTSGLADDLIGDGFGGRPARIRPMEVSYVSELAPALEAPPPVVMPPMPPIQPVQRLKPVVPVAPAASAPDQVIDEPAPLSPPEVTTSETPETASAAQEIAQAASASPSTDTASAPASAAAESEPASAVAQTAAPATFDWPPSTRLTYVLSGQYRGEIQGSAQVEWIRQADRYQVLLEITVGPSFAPLMRRRLASEGEIGEGGLSPRRYEEHTKIAFSDPRIDAIRIEADRIVLPRERLLRPLPGVQDTVSQFVQLTWLFRTQPQRLQPGATVEMPLVLPRRQDQWVYDVIGLEAQDTPVGRIDAWHLKPRPLARPAGELTVEMWFAPALQYLPVRFVVRQDAQTFADLLIKRLPQQAAR
jgi:hypothetical protein